MRSGKLKRIIGATLGFKSMKTAYATIKGIEDDALHYAKARPQHFIMVIPWAKCCLVSRVFEM